MYDFLKKVIIFILTWEARLVLARYRPKIIAVTGSVGKTTAKDAIFAVLSGSLFVRKSEKSFNSELGVPLAILGLENAWRSPVGWARNIFSGIVLLFGRDYPNWLVLEVGADRPGDIRRIARWLRPHIAVVTGVPEIPVHVEYFDSPEALAREKRVLAAYIRAGGKLVLNGDDSRMVALCSDYRGMTVKYGFGAGNDLTGGEEEIAYTNYGPSGIRFRVNGRGASIPVSVSGALGRPRAYAALAALAVAEIVGVDIVSGTQALAALDALKEVKAERKIAVLGDMLELGKYSAEAHRNVGSRAAECAGRLVTVGFRARAMGEAALDAGMPEGSIREYEHTESGRAGEELRGELKEGDIVLVKGSQSMRMERTVEVLMAEPDRATELLVRQDAEWHNR